MVSSTEVVVINHHHHQNPNRYFIGKELPGDYSDAARRDATTDTFRGIFR